MKQWIAIALLAATSAAQAEVAHFNVKYQGFYDEQAGAFNPDLVLSARFDADDLNGDGTYSVDELISFRFDSIYWGQSNTGCRFDYPTQTCLDSFTYTLGDAPSFSASMYVSDEMRPWSMSIETGKRYGYANFGSGESTEWTWTGATQTYVNGVSVSPVPEPAQYGMLAAGLGLLALARRQRRT